MTVDLSGLIGKECTRDGNRGTIVGGFVLDRGVTLVVVCGGKLFHWRYDTVTEVW